MPPRAKQSIEPLVYLSYLADYARSLAKEELTMEDLYVRGLMAYIDSLKGIDRLAKEREELMSERNALSGLRAKLIQEHLESLSCSTTAESFDPF